MNATSRDPPSSPAPEAAGWLVGRAVQKHFDGHGIFGGRVVEYSPPHRWYTVQYDDGDREELREDEVKKLLLTDTNVTEKEDVEVSEASMERKLPDTTTDQAMALIKPKCANHAGSLKRPCTTSDSMSHAPDNAEGNAANPRKTLKQVSQNTACDHSHWRFSNTGVSTCIFLLLLYIPLITHIAQL